MVVEIKKPKEFYRKLEHKGIDKNFTKEELFEYCSKQTSHETVPDSSNENDMDIDTNDCLNSTLPFQKSKVIKYSKQLGSG